MSTDRKPDPSRRRQQSRDSILEAALALVLEVGYSKTSIESIASRAGVGKQTIYRWWPSKGAVVFDSVLAHAGVEDGVQLPDTGDVEADLKQVLRATVAEFADPAFEAPIRALNSEIIFDADLAAAYRERMAAPVEEAKKVRLRSAQAAGQLDPDADLDLLLELLYAPVYQRWLLRTAPLTQEYADQLVETVLRTFAPARTPTSP
ncbi:TetR/AcrR family transcriptional regulator [Umezawaea beigongshangensis]|uniref:TetR/AcrR family transcriptional regulator n=1 Tax=Umezawaea beigongshangensis TaxID=2780383 RepID=UPI0018F199E3|nr:TetR/AcrR family transcriptional regulator [Umezawaea beigongshangensis]